MIGKLEETNNLRVVWDTEAKFTSWLAEDKNIKILSEASGLNIAVEEVSSHEILASDRDTGKRIEIENQLEETEHNYLGQLITNAAGKDAKIIIWLAGNSRREHKYAAEWLNSNLTNVKIYLFRIRLYRVGDSEPAVYAVRFEPIVKPEVKPEIKTSENAANIANIDELRFNYWNKFQDYAFNDARDKSFSSYYKRWANSSTSTLYLGTGRQGVNVFVSKTLTELEAGLYISNDQKLFQYFLNHMEAIESESGIQFEWPVNSDGKDFRISTGKISAPIEDNNDWENQFDWIINTVLTMRKVFGKYISLSSGEE